MPLFHTTLGRDGVFFQAEQQWTTSYYCGTSILLLALLGILLDRSRRTWVMLGLCLASFLLALGEHGGLYPLLRWLLPGLGVMRYPIKFIVPAVVLLPLLAARGTSSWIKGSASDRFLVGTTAALTLAAFTVLAVSRWSPIPGENWSLVARSGIVSVVSIFALAVTLSWLRRTNSFERRSLLSVFLGLLVFADLWLANRGINPTAPTEFFKTNLAALEPRPKLGERRAMVSSQAHALLDETIFPNAEVAVKVPRQSLLLNANLLEGIPKLDGFFSLYLRNVAHLIWRLTQQTNPPPAGLLDFLSVSHISDPATPWLWKPRTNSLPLFTLVPHAVFLDGTNALEKLLAPDFDPRREVIIPTAIQQELLTDVETRGKILRQTMHAHECSATLETETPMILAISQSNYPGWRAQIDHQDVPIWTANFAFQAIQVPAGRHDVTLSFRSKSFELGAGISLGTLIFGLGCAVCTRRSRSAP